MVIFLVFVVGSEKSCWSPWQKGTIVQVKIGKKLKKPGFAKKR